MIATMANDQTEELLQEVITLIEEACANGDTISAIAERSKLSRPQISRIRNNNLRQDEFPKIETLARLVEALGYRVSLKIQKA